MDELWSFVDHIGNKQWVWLALDVLTHEIVRCFIGYRSFSKSIDNHVGAIWNLIDHYNDQLQVHASDYSSTRVVQDIQNRSKTSADYIYAAVS
jgi:insertion element IS1 protein InsB